MSKELSELLCRACLQDDELLVDIYEHVDELNMNLSELLTLCGDIVVDQFDAYPKFLCQQCTRELLIAAKFRKKCAESQQMLHQLDGIEERQSGAELSADLLSDCDELIEVDASEPVHEVVVECEEPRASKSACLYSCDDCGAVFQQTATLQRHMEKAHAHAPLYSCQLCGHSFTQLPKLQSHGCRPVAATSNGAKHCHRCLDCGKSFQSASSLTIHRRTHTGESPYACDACPKTFKTASALVGHQKRHLQLAEHKCPHCDKRFVESTNLRRHIVALHTEQRPHSCTVCQRSFSRVYLLELHMRTHTGERPYACSMCDRSFSQQGVLRRHERAHMGIRPHRCSQCKQSFSRPSLLRQHERKHLTESTLCNDQQTLALVVISEELEASQ